MKFDYLASIIVGGAIPQERTLREMPRKHWYSGSCLECGYKSRFRAPATKYNAEFVYFKSSKSRRVYSCRRTKFKLFTGGSALPFLTACFPLTYLFYQVKYLSSVETRFSICITHTNSGNFLRYQSQPIN